MGTLSDPHAEMWAALWKLKAEHDIELAAQRADIEARTKGKTEQERWDVIASLYPFDSDQDCCPTCVYGDDYIEATEAAGL